MVRSMPSRNIFINIPTSSSGKIRTTSAVSPTVSYHAYPPYLPEAEREGVSCIISTRAVSRADQGTVFAVKPFTGVPVHLRYVIPSFSVVVQNQKRWNTTPNNTSQHTTHGQGCRPDKARTSTTAAAAAVALKAMILLQQYRRVAHLFVKSAASNYSVP